VWLRPLYAWDAWMNWAPKAITWFHQGQLVEFVHHMVWLDEGDITTYTLGNRMASLYPENLPLILLWTMLGLGTWDSGLAYLPWVIAPLALGLALYGHLRLAGVGFFAAALACYALLNMPYPNVHSALAGYADSWLGMVFCLAVLSLYELGRNRHWAYVVLCLYLAVFCGQLKNPGVVLGLIVAAVTLRECLRLKTVVEWTAATTIVAVVAALLVLGIDVNIPGLGRFSIGASGIHIPGLRPYELSFHNVSAAWLETLFISWNWNLLWYLLVAGIVYGLGVKPRLGRVTPEMLAALGALCFLLFVFFFTRHHQAATSFITLNRTLLYLVPTLVFIAALRYAAGSSVPASNPAGETRPEPRQPTEDQAAN
jgi:hypothetical protein